MSASPVLGTASKAPLTTQQPTRYVGLVTRGIAFALDAAVINVVAIFVEVGAALILSLLHLPHDLKKVVAVIGGVVYVAWAFWYFVGFWSGTGQTPGNRVMQIRVLTRKGEVIKPRWAIVRCVGLLLAALPLFAGYLMILFNRRRRGLQDYLAHTVVVEAPQVSVANQRREQARLARAATGGGAGSNPAAQTARLHGSSDSGDDRHSSHVQA